MGLRSIINMTKRKVKNVLGASSASARQTLKNAGKNAFEKADPFNRKINKNDVTDTGVESLRLGYTTVKKAKNTVKTAARGIKTVQSGVKTTANATKVIVKKVYRTAVNTVKAAVFVTKTTVNVVIHVAAALTNPLVWIIIAAALFFFVIINGVIIILFGSDLSTREAYMNAAGLGDVSDAYNNGLALFQSAIDSRKAEYDALIDALYYNGADLTNSDLVYMVRTIYGEPVNSTTYMTDLASDGYKGTLHNAWSFQLDPTDALAIAYVYLEMQQNADHGTEADIYDVTYTQEVFDEILNICVQFAEEVHGNYTCPNENCTTIQVDNPEWQDACDRSNEAAVNYNAALAAGDQSGMDYWGAIYVAATQRRDSLPSKIDQQVCEHQHDLHSIGLSFLTADDIMNALQFTDKDKEWFKYTKAGLRSETATE